jgi:UDP-N-acetylmuramate dehydrogenase
MDLKHGMRSRACAPSTGRRLQIREPREYAVGYRSVVPVQAREEFFVAAWFQFARGNGDRARQKIKELLAKRIATQPLAEPNAGSVIPQSPGDHAARLIEASGLKGSGWAARRCHPFTQILSSTKAARRRKTSKN